MSGVPENLLSVLDRWLDSRLDEIHTAFPAVVQGYDPATTTVSVTPLISIRLSSGAIAKLPALRGLPVMFPSSSEFQMRWPLKRGDGVLVIVSEASLGNWYNGQGSAQLDPEDESRFTLGDGIAIPGLWSRSSAPFKDMEPDALQLRFRDTTLVMDGTTVVIDAPGGFQFTGDLSVDGTISASGEVSANASSPATAVNLSTHIHPTPVGPTSAPTPGV